MHERCDKFKGDECDEIRRAKMPTFVTECPCCQKVFKTLFSLRKHVRERHEGIDEASLIPAFKDSDGKVTLLPKPREALEGESQAGYRMWLNGLIERINSTFHPRLPGKYTVKPVHRDTLGNDVVSA